LDDRSKSDTAFVCHKGLFYFSAMPFGFTNAPVVLLWLVQRILVELIYYSCFVFVNSKC